MKRAWVEPDGGLCEPLRADRRLAWAKWDTVPLDGEGCDMHGRYHGRTGVPLYAIQYADGEIIFFRDKGSTPDIAKRLRRRYPKAEIIKGQIDGLTLGPFDWKIRPEISPPKEPEQIELFEPDQPELFPRERE